MLDTVPACIAYLVIICHLLDYNTVETATGPDDPRLRAFSRRLHQLGMV